MRAILSQINSLTAVLCIAAAAPGWLSTGALAADDGLAPLVTADMGAQLRPEIRKQLEEAAQLAAFARPSEALELLAPLQAQLEDGLLNYWETFDYQLIVGEANLKSRDWRAARGALEECLKFADIDSYRRQKALIAIAKAYVQLKEAERAIAVYEEINGLRGGRDPQTLTRIAQVHDVMLRDRTTAILYLEEAVQYGADNPDRSRYQLLSRAYLQTGQLDKALETTRAMVKLFDVPSDLDAMEDIIVAMNKRQR